MAKQTKKKAVKKKSSNSTKSKLLFPKATLGDAVRIVMAIKEKNGGNPWSPEDVGNAMGVSYKTNSFYYISAAARDFGLTDGTRAAKKIALTDFGKKLAYPESPEELLQLKREAFFKVPLFEKVFNYYKGNNLPEMEYLSNTLKATFKLPEKDHKEFSELFKANCGYVEIDKLSKETDPESEKVTGNTTKTITMAEANNSDLTCFVIMPFREREETRAKGFFDEVLRSLITPAGREAGFNVKTANRKGSDVIQSTIINDLLNADLVLADLTEHNPNVLFELGMRMAEDKPVALIRSEGTGAIFDVDNMLRVYDYNPNLWPTTVSKDIPKLQEFIRASWDNRNSDQTYLKIL
jgi:hypothetical protein